MKHLDEPCRQWNYTVSGGGGEAVDTSAVCTATADEFWCLDLIHYSLSAAPAAHLTLTVIFGSTARWTWILNKDIVSDSLEFPRGLYREVKNELMKVAISAPLGGVVATINILYR